MNDLKLLSMIVMTVIICNLSFLFLQLEYKPCKKMEEKIDLTLPRSGQKIPILAEYSRMLIKATIKRALAIVAYKPSYTILKSRLVLFRPTLNTFALESVSFGLEEISEKPVTVHIIERNHSTILLNPDVCKYINSYL